MLAGWGCQGSGAGDSLSGNAGAAETSKAVVQSAKGIDETRRAQLGSQVTQSTQQMQAQARAMKGELTPAEKQAAIEAYQRSHP